MSILASLERAYHRLATEDKVPPIGYSNERIDYCVVLKADGQPDGEPVDLRDHSGRKPVAPRHSVPRPEKRAGKTLLPSFLWDKVSYSLGAMEDLGRRGPRHQRAACRVGGEAVRGFSGPAPRCPEK